MVCSLFDCPFVVLRYTPILPIDVVWNPLLLLIISITLRTTFYNSATAILKYSNNSNISIFLLFLSKIVYNVNTFSTRTGGIALKFEWDEDKNQLNLKKHGIDFETAMLVFNDLQRIEIYDMEHSINEDRYNTIGMVNDVLFVVYTERKENIRLISARLATKTERSIYYDTDSYFG